MSEQNGGSEPAHPMDRVTQAAGKLYDRFLSIAGANACFGEPIKVDDKTLIPAAEVMAASGFGMGYGQGQEVKEDTDENGSEGEGGGAGAGGMSRSRSVAVIVVSESGVTVEPVVDATQIAMAGIVALAFVGYWLLRLTKSAGETTTKGPSLRSFKKLLS